VISHDHTIPSGYNLKEILYCPAGKVAVGGSGVPTGLAQDPDGRFSVIYSGLADYSSWIIKETNGTDEEVHVTYSVICVTAP